MIQGLVIERANTILYCRRWKETVGFYRDVIGLPIAFTSDWFVEFEICPNSFISIADQSRATIDPVEGQGITITWRVADPTAVRAALDEQGVAVTPIARRWSALAFSCRDPEGHRLEFWSDASTPNSDEAV